MTAQPNRRQKLKHAQLSPYHIYIVPIICFSCVYLMPQHTVSFTATEQIRHFRYILCLSCTYLVPILCRFQQAK